MMFSKKQIKLYISILLLLLALSACEMMTSPTEELFECTAIGCDDNLTVWIYGDIPDEFMMVFEASVHPMVNVKCPSGEIHGAVMLEDGCDSRILTLENYAPQEVTITLSWDDTTIERVFQPEYETIHPNGLDCPPECRFGGIVIDVP